jgi:molybdopterin converting factor small subunit
MAGILDRLIPNHETVVEVDDTTVQGVLNALVRAHGPRVEQELLDDGKLRKGLSLLLNGRNVLSLPDMFATVLRDGDEVVITVQVSGG